MNINYFDYFSFSELAYIDLLLNNKVVIWSNEQLEKLEIIKNKLRKIYENYN